MGAYMKKTKLRRFFEKHQLTLMVIPNAKKDIRQVKANKLLVGFVALLSLSLVSFVVIENITLKMTNTSLNDDNYTLHVENTIKADAIRNLQSMNGELTTENEELEEAHYASAMYFNDKMKEVIDLQDQLLSFVAMLNEETDSNITLPVTRSLSVERLNEINDEIASNNSGLVVDDRGDEITSLIKEQIEEFADLTADVKNQLDFLDAKPDLVPTQGRFTSGYGYRIDPLYGTRQFHRGIDIANSIGTEIVAAGSGVVTYSGMQGGFGYVTIINHGYNYYTVYAHCNKLYKEVGDSVKKGEAIAEIGNTGKSTGPHLHFEIRYNGSSINPWDVLKTD